MPKSPTRRIPTTATWTQRTAPSIQRWHTRLRPAAPARPHPGVPHRTTRPTRSAPACSTSTSPKAPRRATMGRSTTILARAAADRTHLRPDAGAGHRQQGGEPVHATERRVHAVPRCEGRTTFILFFSPLRQLNAALSLTRRMRAHCPHHWQCVHAEPHHYLRPRKPCSFLLLLLFMLRSYLSRQEGSKSLPRLPSPPTTQPPTSRHQLCRPRPTGGPPAAADR